MNIAEKHFCTACFHVNVVAHHVDIAQLCGCTALIKDKIFK